MIGIADLVGVLVIVGVNTLVAALMLRIFRVTLDTDWGSAVYSLLLVPLALVATTFVLSGVLGLGGDLGGRGTVVLLVFVLPMALGFALDYFWMPHPDEVTLPDNV